MFNSLRNHLEHSFSKFSVRSPRASRENPMGSASYLFTFVFIFRNLFWGSVNNGQPLHGLHNTKRLRTTDVGDEQNGPHSISRFFKNCLPEEQSLRFSDLKISFHSFFQQFTFLMLECFNQIINRETFNSRRYRLLE